MRKAARKNTKTKERGIHTERIDFRLTKKDKNRILFLAKTYAGGNTSLWLTHAGLNADRKYLVK